jgi:hypothetical protein
VEGGDDLGERDLVSDLHPALVPFQYHLAPLLRSL